MEMRITEMYDKAIKICEDNLPFMNECKDKRQLVVFTLMVTMATLKEI